MTGHGYFQDIFREAQSGNASARERIALDNIGLVRSIVKRFRNTGEEPEDLINVGFIGLLKAIDRFRPEFGHEFSTYAFHLIVGEIKRYLRDQGGMQVPRRLKDLAWRAREAENQLAMSLGRSPTVNEVADSLGTSPDEIVLAMESSKPLISLDGCAGGEDVEGAPGERVGDSPLEEYAGFLDLKEVIANLAPRERLLISLRYYHGESQEQVAFRLGISQSRVSRWEKSILRKIREQISSR